MVAPARRGAHGVTQAVSYAHFSDMAGQGVVVAPGQAGRPTVAAMRVVGYVRLSTDRQVDAGAGLDVQRRAVRAWRRAEGTPARRPGGRAGVSGTLTDSPALAEALVLLRERKARGLIPRESLWSARHLAPAHGCDRSPG